MLKRCVCLCVCVHVAFRYLLEENHWCAIGIKHISICDWEKIAINYSAVGSGMNKHGLVRCYCETLPEENCSCSRGPRDLQSTAQGPVDTIADEGVLKNNEERYWQFPWLLRNNKNNEYCAQNVLQFLWCVFDDLWNQVCLLGLPLTLCLKTQATWPFPQSHSSSLGHWENWSQRKDSK